MDDKIEMSQPNATENLLPSTHTSLRDQLISRTLGPDDFLDKLMELDQTNKDLPTYEGNIQLLEDPQIRALVENPNNPYLQHTFLDRLAFFRYHQAQHRAASGDIRATLTFERALGDKLQARAYLTRLLTKPETDDKLKIFIHDIVDEKAGDTLFTLYMQANAAYMRRQPDGVKKYHDQLSQLAPDAVNTKIVGNLLNGLEEGKTPDYKTDHHP